MAWSYIPSSVAKNEALPSSINKTILYVWFFLSEFEDFFTLIINPSGKELSQLTNGRVKKKGK